VALAERAGRLLGADPLAVLSLDDPDHCVLLEAAVQRAEHTQAGRDEAQARLTDAIESLTELLLAAFGQPRST
jgi:hypothetical protein